jgi:hypothetical protein
MLILLPKSIRKKLRLFKRLKKCQILSIVLKCTNHFIALKKKKLEVTKVYVLSFKKKMFCMINVMATVFYVIKHVLNVIKCTYNVETQWKSIEFVSQVPLGIK